MIKIGRKKINYFFVDEAGDPIFYNRHGRCIVGEEGCSKILSVGFITTNKPEILRKEVLSLRKEIVSDDYLKDVPSIEKTIRAFHAKDDCPEVREKFYKLLRKMDFKAEFIVARKDESIFSEKHKGKTNLFYDDLVIELFKNKLHIAEKSKIYFAVRGDRKRQAPLEEAIHSAKIAFENHHNIKIDSDFEIIPQTPSGEPCLQIVDYMNWAIQRAFLKREDRYIKFVLDKISYMVDIYDFEKYPKNHYNRKNRFDINKISPL